MGDAVVRMEQGQPCVGIAEETARRQELKLVAIVLSDVSAVPAERVWVLSRLPAPSPGEAEMPMPPGRCVRLGMPPAGYAAPALPPLEPGRLYEVYVNAPPVSGRREARGYTRRFCIGPGNTLLTLAPNAEQCAAR
jgi:hypothetical protein